MSNLYHILSALASERGVCIDQSSAKQIISLIGSGAPTAEGVKLLYDTLALIRPSESVYYSEKRPLAVSQLQMDQVRSSSAQYQRLSASELFSRHSKPFYYERSHEEIMPITNDPVSPSRFRTPKVRVATIEHAYRMQLARVRRYMESNFYSERFQGEACYSYRKRSKFDQAASVFPELEKTYRELRESKWM